MAVRPRKDKQGRITSYRVMWRLNGARDGAWQTVGGFESTTGARKRAEALDAWLRAEGYTLTADDPRVIGYLGRTPKVEPATEAPTLGALVEAMHASKRKLADTSHANYTRLVNRLGEYADMPADRFTHEHAMALFDALDERYAPSTLHASLGLLKVAVAKHVDVATVFAGIAYGKGEGTVKPIILTDDQTRALIAGAGSSGLALPIFVTINAGLRWSELAGLQAKHVDLARGEIAVRWQLKHRETRKHGFAVKPLKTDASERVVPIGPTVVDALALVAELPADAPVFFPDYAEWWLHPSFQYQWQALKARTPSVPADTRWHDLRHTCAMRWLRGTAGAPVPLGLVSRMLGHATTDITADIYGSHWDETDHARIVAAGMAW
jgi:integrase